MRSVTVIILHAFVAQGHGNDFFDKLVDKLADKLVVRAIEVSPIHHAELDNTTFCKSNQFAAPTSWRTVAASAAVALRDQEATKVTSKFRARETCDLECDFSGRSAPAAQVVNSNYLDSLSRRRPPWNVPSSVLSTPPKTSCEFQAGCSVLPFEPTAVGTYSYQGQRSSTRTKINQDCGSVVYPFGGNPEQAFFAVFDGHGDGGEKVCEFTLKVVEDTLEKHPGLVGMEAAAFEAAFTNADHRLATEREFRRRIENSGTTAIAALMRGNQVWVANAGDSRCILASKSTGAKIKTRDLSKDQKPDSPGERERIEQSGGVVKNPEPPKSFSARVFPPTEVNEYPGLAVSRSIGDFAVKKVGVIASPDVKVYDFNSDDLFMILASDGVWEFISSQEAAEIVWEVLHSGGGNAFKATEHLIEIATLRWRKEEGDYRDDITAIVIDLPLFKQV